MHFSCQCGNVIHDTSDNLSYKGYIIADQDIDYLIETIEKLEKPHTQYIGVYDEISKLLRRTVYQCPDCGRVYIENLAHDYKLVGFNPDSEKQQEGNDNKKLLLSTFGEKWKGYLSADWNDDIPDWQEHHGIIMPEVNVKFKNLEFDAFESFKRRFFEVLEYMKHMNIVSSAVLHVNGKRTYVWPESERR